jgi:hypothetical protein
VSPTYEEMVTQNECISGRVMKIGIIMKEKEMNTLQIYAPQMGCNNEEKEEFNGILEDNASGEYNCITGHFNAQKGEDR